MTNLSPVSTTTTRADRKRFFRPTSRWFIVCLSSLSIVACSSDDSIENEGYVEHPSLQGEFLVKEFQANGQREISMMAGFTDHPGSVFMNPEIIDKCFYSDYPEPSSNQSGMRAIPPIPISAGPLIVSNSAGTLATLTYDPKNIQPFEAYISDSIAVTAEAATSMSLDISGDFFPALPTIKIQEIDPINVSQPGLNTATSIDTIITWNTSQYSNTFITMFVKADGDDGAASYYYCKAIDDGEFNVYDFFQSELTGEFTVLSLDRNRYEAHYLNDTYLSVQRSIAAGL